MQITPLLECKVLNKDCSCDICSCDILIIRYPRLGRLTDDGVTSRQDAVNYPIKQNSIREQSGHDLPDESTESSSLRGEEDKKPHR